MKRLMCLLLLCGIGMGYGLRGEVDSWRIQRLLSRPYETLRVDPRMTADITSCSALWLDSYDERTSTRVGVRIACDGQVYVEGPRDEAAQAFWDKVIELTPNTYLAPRRVIAELSR
jgi:hypothetical protein